MYLGERGNWGDPVKEMPCDQFTEYQFYSGNCMIEVSLRDEKGFFDLVGDKDYGGLTHDMISFNNTRKLEHHCIHQTTGETSVQECIVDGDTWFQNYPGNWGMFVPDPRDLFGRLTVAEGHRWTTDSIDKYIQGLKDNIKAASDVAADLDYNGEIDDAVLTLAVPVLLLRQTVESMKSARDAADREAKAKHDDYVKNIMSIISTVLSGVGLVGGVVGAAEGFIAELANLVNLAVLAVGAGYTIATIALNQSDWFNDLMAVLTAISAAGMMSGGRAGAAAEAPEGDLLARGASAYRTGISDRGYGALPATSLSPI